MSFNYNNVNAGTPPGAIMATLITTDPSGWVIADGSERQYFTIYDGLISLAIGSKVGATYTPPNLKGAFLRGIGNTSFNSVTYTAQTGIKTFQDNAIEQHSHPASQTAHNHTTNSETNSGNTATKNGIGMINGSYTESSSVNGPESGQINVFNVYDFSFSMVTPNITVQNSTDGPSDNLSVYFDNNSAETAPFCYGVNWAIKL